MKKRIFPDMPTVAALPEQKTSAATMKEIFMTYYPRLAYFAENLLKDRQEAEDVASSALGKLWENMSGPEDKVVANIEAWLFVIARNACYNYLKHQKVKRKSGEYIIGDLESISHDIEANLIEEDIINKLFIEICQLPGRCKQVAELIYIHGCTPSEVSQKLGITASTVRSQQARAIELIRTSLIRKKIFIEPAILLLFLFSLDR
ncbi:MAG: sigma-70 family RNA polymerase sigma factor [Flavitalea sp.]